MRRVPAMADIDSQAPGSSGGSASGVCGAFQDRTSMDRILFAIFIHKNKQSGISTLFPLTHNS